MTSIVSFSKSLECKKYKRIVSLIISGDEMILSLVEKDRIVGLSGKISEDIDMSNVWEKAKDFPKVEKNIETMIEMEPDLVIAADWMKKEFLLQIEETGANVYIYKTPKNFEDQKKIIKELSILVDERKRGELIIEDMETRLSRVQKKISEKKSEEKLKVLVYKSSEVTRGKETTFDDMIKLIGGRNIASESGLRGAEKISKEKIIELNPDIIIIPVWSNHMKSDEFSEFIVNDSSFKDVKAVKTKNVIAVKHKIISTTSQYMINGIEELARVIYNLEEITNDKK